MSSLFRSSAIVSVMTLLSRVLGLARDLAIAAVFGAGITSDVFFVAFLIPNMFRRIFAEGAFSKGFIPVFNQIKTQESAVSLQQFSSAVFWRLFAVVAIVVLLGMIFAPQIIPLFANEFTEHGGAYAQAISLLRVMFPYLLFISLAAFMTGVLNSYQQFALPAFGPVLLNISLLVVLSICAYAATANVLWLGWGVLVGGFLHLAILVRPVLRHHVLMLPKASDGSHPAVSQVLKLMLPVILGSSAIQINQIINTQLNTSVGAGAQSWFYYADRLFQFPVGMFGVALGAVVLPRLSRAVSSDAQGDFVETLRWALRLILLIAIPSAIGLLLLSRELSLTLYQRGAFSVEDADMTAKALAAMSIAVIGYMLVQVLSAAHYAQQDTKRPAIIGVIAVVVNIIIGVSLIGTLGHVATATAVSVSAMTNAFLLAFTLPQARALLLEMIKDGFLLRLAFGGAVMALLVLVLSLDWSLWQMATQKVRIVWLLGIIAAAAISYLGILQILGVQLQRYIRHQ